MSIEIEFKYRVGSEADLMAIEKAAAGVVLERIQQDNVFFDTPERHLDRAKFIMRVRIENLVGEEPHFLLTAKGPSEVLADGTLTKKVEEEFRIKAKTADGLLDGEKPSILKILAHPPCPPSRKALVAKIRKAKQGKGLAAVGGFANHRTRIQAQLPTGQKEETIELILELDRTEFLGEIHHFEMEAEVREDQTEKAEAALKLLLQKAGVEGRAAPGKAKRFFMALRGESID